MFYKYRFFLIQMDLVIMIDLFSNIKYRNNKYIVVSRGWAIAQDKQEAILFRHRMLRFFS